MGPTKPPLKQLPASHALDAHYQKSRDIRLR